MRDYQPATIRFHRPTNSNIETTRSREYALTRNGSESLEKSLEFKSKDELRSFCRMGSFSFVSEEDTLEKEQHTLMNRLEDLLKSTSLFTKHERIRIKEWITKLSWKQSNPIWKKNVNFYLKVLI
jgi:hypothetical protein